MRKPHEIFIKKKQIPESEEQFFQVLNIEFLIHELKDPIAVIESNMLNLLNKREKHGTLSELQERVIRRSLRNSQKAREMLNGLLEIGRSETGCCEASTFKPFKSVNRTLLDSLETMTGAVIDSDKLIEQEKEILELFVNHKIRLAIDSPLIDIEIYQDEIKFRQIVGNLVKNAIHHRREWVDIKISQKDKQLLVDISDDGPGIDPKHHEMIFKRYTQVEQRSTTFRNGHGLGLAGSRILARHLGGDVQIISRKVKWVTFRLMLPLSMEDPSK